MRRWLALAWLVAPLVAAADVVGARLHMQAHLERIDAIRSALVVGSVESVREPAAWLAVHEPPADIDLVYEPFILSLRDHARQIAAARDIATAAGATASIGVDCGNCHRAAGVEPAFGPQGEPPSWPDTASHMQRHRWAIDRLWDGLSLPSDAAWERGTSALAEAPLLGTVMGRDDGGEEADALAQRVHALGRDAASALTPDARATLFGKLVSACADCHRRAHDAPRPD
jgi:cytochrome c553